MRATLGHLGVDERYRENWNEARWAGFPSYGLYHYYITESHPLRQLDHIFRTTGGDFGNVPFTLDCERRADEKTRPFNRFAYTTNVRLFLLGWAERTRHPIRIYTSRVEWAAITLEPEWLSEYEVHVAHYNPLIAQPWLPRHVSTWAVWQYSSTGRIAGVAGDVDLNRIQSAAAVDAWVPVKEEIRARLGRVDGMLR